MSSLITILEHNGFSSKEASIYLAALELGSAPASSIARKAGVNRVTTYTVLKQLSQQGFITTYQRDKTTYFSAVDPKLLVQIIKQRYQKLEEHIPAFAMLADKPRNNTKVEYFEGADAIYEQYFDLLENYVEDIRSFYSYHNTQRELRKRLFEGFVPERIKRQVFAKVIMNGDTENPTYKQLGEKELCKETLIVPEEVFVIESNIDIYAGNKIAVWTIQDEEMYGMIIHSQKFHDTMAGIFDLLRSTYHSPQPKT